MPTTDTQDKLCRSTPLLCATKLDLWRIHHLAHRALGAQTRLASYVAELSGDDEVHVDVRSIRDLHRTAQLLIQEHGIDCSVSITQRTEA